MNTAYKILFAVDLLNEYYSNGKCTDISILPSLSTAQLMRDRRMLCKTVGNKLVVLIKVKDEFEGANADKPFVPLGDDVKFLFYLQLDKPVFTAYTNIDDDAFKTKRYYFSNIFETKSGTVLNLSAPLDSYSSAIAYKPGDLVTDGGSVAFECVKDKLAGVDDNATEAWRKLGKWEVTNVLTLDNPVAAFSNATAYKKFDIVQNAAKVFECINDTIAGTPTSDAGFWIELGDLAGNQLTPPSNYKKFDEVNSYALFDKIRNSTEEVHEYYVKTIVGSNTGNEKYWFNRGINAYASTNDMYAFVNRVTTFTAKTAATNFQIRIFAFNPATGLFDVEITIAHDSVSVGSTPTDKVQVNMQELSDGRYVIKINGEDYAGGTDTNGDPIPIYWSDDVVFRNFIGVVEIFNSISSASDFSLLDASGKVKDKIVAGKSTWLNYVIRFANKLATWKYIARQGGVKSVKDAVPGYVFNKTTVDQQDFFESNRPIILSEKPSAFELLLTNAVSSQPPPAPNPDPQITGMISRTNSDYFCNIYLHY